MQFTNLKLQRISSHICFNIHSKNGIIKKACAILALILLLLGGCHKNDNPVSTDQLSRGILGQVIDSQGKPVEGCGVHYIYTMTTSALAKVGKTCPSLSITYVIEKRSKVTLKVLRYFTRDSIATLVNDSLNAGTYRVTIDASKITNGIYYYQLKCDTAIQEKLMALLNNDVSTLINADPLATTNSSGEFSLPYGILGFGVPLVQTSATGSPMDSVYISHTIQIVLAKTGYLTLTKTITIDEAKGMSQTFTLAK